ncbi:hypothetical protein [[Eubacterium] cellulosolvens]
MRHTSTIVILIFIILILPGSQGFLGAAPITGNITTFSDNTSEKNIMFPSDEETNRTVNISLPYKAVVTNSSFYVNTIPNATGNYTYQPQIDVGGDGDPEWAFKGLGYGQFGRQNVFRDGLGVYPLVFEQNNSYNNNIRFLLPKNATVTSASLNLSGIGTKVIEDFENGATTNWPWSPWVQSSSGGSVGTTYAHDGSYGFLGSGGWYYRTDITLGSTGDKLSWWTRFTGSSAGRSYLGFGASSSGCWSLVCADNTGDIIIQQNSGFNFRDLVSKTFSWSSNKWYRAEIVFNNNNGYVTGKIYDSNGITLLATLSTNLSGFSAGGVAMRSFSNYQMDTIETGTGFGGTTLENFTMDIGDNGGVPEVNHTGKFNASIIVTGFSAELNLMLAASNISFTDDYGLDFVELAINISNNESGTMQLSELDIRYNLSAKVFKNPHNVNLTNELNELIPETGEGNFQLPIVIKSFSKGGLALSNISIDYFLPELTNDRLTIYGQDWGTICYTDYRNYVFQANVTNRAGISDVNNVTLTLDVYGETIKLRWFQGNSTFIKLMGPNDLIWFDLPNCTSIPLDGERWSLNFSLRFKWTHQNEEFKYCALNTTNDTGSWVRNEFPNVYRVENDLDLIGSLKVTGQYQGALADGDWVRANEQLTWSNLKVVYEGTVNKYPDDKNFNITITDDESGTWMNTSSSGKTFTIKTVSDAYTDPYNLHDINITDIPGFGEDVSNWTFMIRTDNDKPTVPPKIECHADSPADTETLVDDDATIYVTWDDADDGTGSGVGKYAMDFNTNPPTSIKKSGDTDVGVEGESVFYVRACDNVGNWGPVGSDAIEIDLTDLTFTDPIPDPEAWHGTRTIECGVMISDMGGSGVKSDSIYYRYVDKGSITSGTWKRYTGATLDAEKIMCKENITFKTDGAYKKVQWRAIDVAGNAIIDSNYYQLKIDSTPIIFSSFSLEFNDWHYTRTPKIIFYANDTKPQDDLCSGVDVDSLMYQLSLTGPTEFGPWVNIDNTSSESVESVLCTIKPQLSEGENNYIRFKGKDFVGNEAITGAYNIKVDTEAPKFSNPVPAANAWCNSTSIQCNITISDESSRLDLTTIRYAISTNGPEKFGKWCKVNLKHLDKTVYGTVTLSANLSFIEGVNNYIRWLAQDTAGNSIVSDSYQICIDVTGCTFDSPEPTPKVWVNTETLLCSIIINDTLGSGVNMGSIEYATSTYGSDNLVNWKSKGLLKLVNDDLGSDIAPYSVRAQVLVRGFREGANNYIRWRARDMAENKYSYSEPYNIQIDVTPVRFISPQPEPGSTQVDLEQNCKITIKDTIGGSGVDPRSIEYRYSSSGISGYNSWRGEGVSQIKLSDGYKFLVFVKFQPGQSNFIQWRVSDNAGNGPSQSDDYNIIINSAPRPIISSPEKSDTKEYDYTSIDDILFNARKTTDPDADDILAYYWESNITGPIGYSEHFTSTLASGMHRITLFVSDGYYHNVSTHVNITVAKYSEVKDLDGDGVPDYIDPDIDNDGYLNDDDAFPLDPAEGLDTDLDGVGNNADEDDDGDGHLDADDEYPLDPDRWKAEAPDYTFVYVAIAIIIALFLIFILFSTIKSRKKDKAKVEPEKVHPEPTTTPRKITPAPVQVMAPSTVIPAPVRLQLPSPIMAYQQSMQIPSQHPYTPSPSGGVIPQEQIPTPTPMFPALPPAYPQPQPQAKAQPPPQQFQPSPMPGQPPQPQQMQVPVPPPIQTPTPMPQSFSIPMHPAPMQEQLFQPQRPMESIMPEPAVSQPRTFTVFNCEHCGASILDPNSCPYCGWERI